MMEDKAMAEDIRFAIIGHGFMGHEHEKMLSDFPGIKLVGIADRDPEQLKDVKEGIKRYSSNEELFADPEVDVVISIMIWYLRQQQLRKILSVKNQ